MFEIIAAIENEFEREFIVELYKTYYEMMYRKAISIVYKKQDADEVVQEAFVRLIEHVQELMSFDPIKVPAYAMVTVKNIAINRHNDTKKENEGGVLISDEELSRWVADEKALPEDIYIHQEELEALADALPKLPENDRLLLESKYILSLSDKEIAKQLNIAPSSVRTYLTRARRKAYAIMKGE